MLTSETFLSTIIHSLIFDPASTLYYTTTPMAPYINKNRSVTMCHFSLQLHQQATDYVQSYKDELFAPCLTMQARSPNSVFYDRAEGAVVEYPYPMLGGHLINPGGISKYLEQRRQAFKCWCGLLSPDVPVFIELWTMSQGSYASCEKCGLNVSLDEKFQTTSMTADYPLLDKNAAAMPTSSPMSIFAAHGLAPQARRNGLRRRHSMVRYLATGGTPEKSRMRAPMVSLSPPSISKL
ncbi:hypothetical protein K439DRAFT_770822 [Ramaria rubella]|nr:hypothetical protein K439DRAFT_770822 [Ramaria rubella]